MAGLALGWLLRAWRGRNERLALAEARRSLQLLETRNASIEAELKTLQAAHNGAIAERASLSTELRLLREQAEQQQNHFEREWLEKFELLSQRTLKAVQQELEAAAHQELSERQQATEERLQRLLFPLRELVEKQEKHVQELGSQTLVQTASLKEQIRQVVEQTQGLISAKEQLIGALSNSKGRGDWGELELVRLLEDSGLLAGVHYEFQVVQPDQSRPDVMIRLPNGHVVFIDAKSLLVPLLKIEEAEQDPAQLADARKKSLQALKTEINKLSARAYQTKSQASVDFVILYVPRESMLRIPLEEEPGLMRDAFRQNVILASPLILMAMLKTIAQGWQQAEISRNAQEIQTLGREFHRRAGLMLERLDKLGQSLCGAGQRYNELLTSFSGRQGLLQQAKRLAEAGCPSEKALPDEASLTPLDTSLETGALWTAQTLLLQSVPEENAD